MREIKYRVWHKEEKKFVSLWAMGWRFEPENGQVYVNGMNVTDRVELIQYTGLKDRNGKEIYEGDIWSDGERIFVVDYKDEHAGFTPFVMDDSCGCCSSDTRKFSDYGEVIGNRLDNPELLVAE